MCVGLKQTHTYQKQKGSTAFPKTLTLGLTPGDDAADAMVFHLGAHSKSLLACKLARQGVPPGTYHGVIVTVDRPALEAKAPVYHPGALDTLGVAGIQNDDRHLVLALYKSERLFQQVRQTLHNHCNSSFGVLQVQLS